WTVCRWVTSRAGMGFWKRFRCVFMSRIFAASRATISKPCSGQPASILSRRSLRVLARSFPAASADGRPGSMGSILYSVLREAGLRRAGRPGLRLRNAFEAGNQRQLVAPFAHGDCHFDSGHRAPEGLAFPDAVEDMTEQQRSEQVPRSMRNL